MEVGVGGWWMLCTEKRSLSSLSFYELLELRGYISYCQAAGVAIFIMTGSSRLGSMMFCELELLEWLVLHLQARIN